MTNLIKYRIHTRTPVDGHQGSTTLRKYLLRDPSTSTDLKNKMDLDVSSALTKTALIHFFPQLQTVLLGDAMQTSRWTLSSTPFSPINAGACLGSRKRHLRCPLAKASCQSHHGPHAHKTRSRALHIKNPWKQFDLSITCRMLRDKKTQQERDRERGHQPRWETDRIDTMADGKKIDYCQKLKFDPRMDGTQLDGSSIRSSLAASLGFITWSLEIGNCSPDLHGLLQCVEPDARRGSENISSRRWQKWCPHRRQRANLSTHCSFFPFS
jgi:hypothetical protein